MAKPPIRIEFRRSGGLAGISLTATATADDLPPEQSEQLQQWLAAQPPQHPRSNAPSSGAADRFQYQLDLDDGQRQHSFAWDETQVPDPIRPVLGTLTRIARPSR